MQIQLFCTSNTLSLAQLLKKLMWFKLKLNHRLPKPVCKLYTFFGHLKDFQPGYGPDKLQSYKMPFFPKALHLKTFFLGHTQKSIFGGATSSGFFIIIITFYVVINLRLGLLSKKASSKWPMESQVQSQEIFLRVFHSNF